MTVDQEKNRFRDTARVRRAEAARAAGPGAAERLKQNVVDVLLPLAALGIPDPGAQGAVVSGYWPLSGEIDVRALLAYLDGRGYVCALPVVVAPDAPLIFRRWTPGVRLEAGPFDTRHPAADAPEVRPDMLLVPLLAFDAEGYRLGYGGGYFDRTLGGLRERGAPVAVGAAFAGQQVDHVPHDRYDQPLDWIVTEEKAVRIGGTP